MIDDFVVGVMLTYLTIRKTLGIFERVKQSMTPRTQQCHGVAVLIFNCYSFHLSENVFGSLLAYLMLP